MLRLFTDDSVPTDRAILQRIADQNMAPHADKMRCPGSFLSKADLYREGIIPPIKTE